MSQLLETSQEQTRTEAPRRSRDELYMYCVIALIAVMPLWWSIQSAYVRFKQPNPQSPWETEILLDAWRVNHGMAAYTPFEQDHATHMYGPLTTHAVALVTRLSGQDFKVDASRWISVVCGVALTAGMIWGFARRSGPLMMFIAATLTLTCFYKARGYFSEGRPDVPSAFFAMLALWMFYLAYTRHKAWIVAGTLMMLIGFGFKQTASAVSIVPGLVVLITRPKHLIRNLAIASIPPIAMTLTILGLKVFLPQVYFYVITGPTLFQFRWQSWPLTTINLLTTNVLFAVMFMLWIFGVETFAISRRASIWVLVTVAVLSISSGAAVAKVAGQTNCYLPAFLAMAAFTIAMLPSTIRKLAEVAPVLPVRLLLGAFIGMILVADTTGVANYDRWANADRVYGDAAYKRVIRHVRKLKGKVICPDDPTIVLQAKGQVGRSVVSELDVSAWKTTPAYLDQELKKADYLVRVTGVWTSPIAITKLQKLGYQQIHDKTFEKTAYSLWQRQKKKKPATQTVSP